MTKLKQTLLATASSVVFAGSAYAADLPLKAAGPMAIPVSNWTGGYIGSHIGVGGVATSCGPAAGTPSYSCDGGDYQTQQTVRDISLLAGVEAGYDWQSRYFVYGIAADWTWTNLKTKSYGVSGSVSYESKVNWLASVRGRAGLAVDNTLIYVTGGVALGNFTESTNVGRAEQYDLTKTQIGWVAGVGVEHKYSRNWSFKAEYLHYDFGSYSQTYTDNASNTYSKTFTHAVDVGRLGLNYRW